MQRNVAVKFSTCNRIQQSLKISLPNAPKEFVNKRERLYYTYDTYQPLHHPQEPVFGPAADAHSPRCPLPRNLLATPSGSCLTSSAPSYGPTAEPTPIPLIKLSLALPVPVIVP